MDLRNRSTEVSVSDYLRVLYRRRWVAILTFAVVMISVTIHTLLATPQFEAKALIDIQDEKSQASVLDDILQIGNSNAVLAEMEVIKSRTLAEKVVVELKLDHRIFEQRPETLRVELENLKIHNRLKGKVFSIEFTEPKGTFEVSSDRMGDLGKGEIGRRFEVEDLAFEVACKSFNPGDSTKFVIYPFRMAVANVQGSTDVRKVGDKTGLVKIIHRSQYPELARNIVNKTIEIYQRLNREERSAQASLALSFIEEQLKVVRSTLSASEIELNQYKEEHGVMILDVEAGTLIENLAKFEVEKSQVELRRHQYVSLGQLLAKGSGAINLPDFSKENTVLANLVLQLVELEAHKKTLLADYTEKFPEVVSTNEKIVQIRMSIRQIVKNTISQLGSQLEATSEIIEKYNDQLKQLPEKERELAGLKRNAAVSAEIYTFLLQKLEEARIAKASTLSNIRVIDMAVVPQGAISPNIRLNLMLGLIAGLLLAVGIAFFLEFIDDSLKTVEEVERHINRPLYGIIPRIPEGGFGQDDSRTESSGLITQASPKSPISEAFRSMRTNIHFADPDQELTTLLVTSAGPSEGKSTIVANLAVTIANSGKKTLLIDCDLRKPNIHNLFQMERGPGLTNTLTGEMDWTEVVKPSETENLSIITSGPIPPNPTEMIDSKAMRDQLEVFKKEFDMILFDSPPVVAVTDAAILSSYIEGVLLVVELGRSRASGVLRAIDLLDKVKANLLGLVTNNISASYRYDYGYYYKYYSADGEKKRSKRGRSRYGQ